MKIHEISFSAGFTNRIKPRTDDLLVNIHHGEMCVEVDNVVFEPGDSEELQKTIELIQKINRMVEEHNRSL